MICIQPRKIAALSLAKRLAEELGVTLGEEVGYDFKSDKKISQNTKLTFMTERIFLDKLIKENQNADPNRSYFKKVKSILLDEVHERNMTIDLIMGLLLQIVKRFPHLKVIICSATVNEDLFKRYFDPCNVLHIMGRTHPVDVIYKPIGDNEEFIQGANKLIKQIC